MYGHTFEFMKIEEAIKQQKFASNHQKLLVNIAYTNSFVTTKITTLLKPHDLSMQQYNVLRILRGQHPNPVSINNITERMIDKMSNASRLVEKLRKKKLIDRRICEHDRRQVDVVLTESGMKVLSEMDNLLPSLEKEMKHLSNKEMETLNNLLDKLRTNE
jgi:DNA-binding MarR family transcriptional regulator